MLFASLQTRAAHAASFSEQNTNEKTVEMQAISAAGRSFYQYGLWTRLVHPEGTSSPVEFAC